MGRGRRRHFGGQCNAGWAPDTVACQTRPLNRPGVRVRGLAWDLGHGFAGILVPPPRATSRNDTTTSHRTGLATRGHPQGWRPRGCPQGRREGGLTAGPGAARGPAFVARARPSSRGPAFVARPDGGSAGRYAADAPAGRNDSTTSHGIAFLRRRWIERSAWTSSGATREMASPDLPARPVRPIRCT